jgi:hypothetical protein
MNDRNSTTEAAVREMAAQFQYPPTPNIAAGVRRRLAAGRPDLQVRGRRSRPLAFAAVALLLVLAAVLAVPPARATLAGLIRAGAVAILTGPAAAPGSSDLAVEGTPLADSLRAIAEPVTLARAAAEFPHPLQRPDTLGRPDEIYLHQGPQFDAVIFFWADEQRPERIAYAFYQIDAVHYASKGVSRLEEANVGGNQGFWLDGPHYFLLPERTLELRLFVAGSVLVWWDGPVTYRLEGADSLEAALAIAESLRPVTPAD